MGASYASIKSAEHIESLMSNKDLSKKKFEFEIHETMLMTPGVLRALRKYLPQTKKWQITIFLDTQEVSRNVQKIIDELLNFNNGTIYYRPELKVTERHPSYMRVGNQFIRC